MVLPLGHHAGLTGEARKRIFTHYRNTVVRPAIHSKVTQQPPPSAPLPWAWIVGGLATLWSHSALEAWWHWRIWQTPPEPAPNECHLCGLRGAPSLTHLLHNCPPVATFAQNRNFQLGYLFQAPISPEDFHVQPEVTRHIVDMQPRTRVL